MFFLWFSYKEAAVLGSLEEQVKKLEGNVQAITKMDKSEHSAEAQKGAHGSNVSQCGPIGNYSKRGSVGAL